MKYLQIYLDVGMAHTKLNSLHHLQQMYVRIHEATEQPTNQPPIKLRTYVPNSRGNSAFLLSAHGQSCRVVLRHKLSHMYRRYQIFHKAWGSVVERGMEGGNRRQGWGLGTQGVRVKITPSNNTRGARRETTQEGVRSPCTR